MYNNDFDLFGGHTDLNGDGKIDSGDKAISYAAYQTLKDKAPVRHSKPKKSFDLLSSSLYIDSNGCIVITSIDTGV